MTNPMLIGITGGIGAGKSVVTHVFQILGAPVYDADNRAKELMVTAPDIRSAITVLFGEKSYSGDELNRRHIASKAFFEPKLLHQLNELVHPAVKVDFEKWVTMQGAAPYVVKEAALLFETGSYQELDSTILVTANQSLRIHRVLQRDKHRNEEDVRAIISRQMSDEEKEKMADVVLCNDGSTMLLPEILKLHESFTQKS